MARALPKGFSQLSSKHTLVDKANTTVIVAAALAAAVVVFSLFAGKALIDKIGYQNLVLGKRNDANKQLEKNVAAKKQLVASYTAFSDAPESVLGTQQSNSKIVLDALPSKYDFPALATSLDGIITGSGMSVESISGADDEIAAQQSSIAPVPVPIPIQFSARGNYDAAQKLIADLQRSIRPIKIATLDFTAGDGGAITVNITGETYYQPAKELGIQVQKVEPNGSKAKSKGTSASSNSTATTKEQQ